MGVVDYAIWDGDAELKELTQPLFKKKRLLVWSIDHHIGPISDMRSLIEPLGVEFIEHTMYHKCDVMCTCDNLKLLPPYDWTALLHPSKEFIKYIELHKVFVPEIARADAFLVSYSASLLDLFLRYNRSVILVHPMK